MKLKKIAYWGSTGLLSAMMFMSVGMYLFNHETMVQAFQHLGYPPYIIYPLALAKFAGVLTILSKPSENLKQWAYAGFSFVFVLAASAHSMVGDGEFAPPLVALALLLTSYFTEPRREEKTSSVPLKTELQGA